MIQIDSHIKQALSKCFSEENGSQLRIAESTGIQQASLSRWISGKNKSMGDHNWLKILPHIKKYLPDNYIPRDIRGKMKAFNQNNYNVATINQVMTGNLSTLNALNADPLAMSLMESFEMLEKRDKLKVLAFTEELLSKISGNDKE